MICASAPPRAMMLSLMLCGCLEAPRASAPPRVVTPAPVVQALAAPAPAGVLALLVEAAGQGGVRVVEPGTTMRSGDRLALRIDLSQPSYVYTLYATASGAPKRLFPNQGDLRLDAGSHRIPAMGQWLRLDQHTGTESLLVVARPTPLSDDDLLSAARAELAKAAPPARVVRRPRPRPLPLLADATAPPPTLLGEVPGMVAREIALDQGMSSVISSAGGLLRFSFIHR